jgi:hypothetical protein
MWQAMSPKPEPDLFASDDPSVSLAAQIQCVEREIRMRGEVYPRRVAAGRMSQKTADREIMLMQAVLATLKGLAR